MGNRDMSRHVPRAREEDAEESTKSRYPPFRIHHVIATYFLSTILATRCGSKSAKCRRLAGTAARARSVTAPLLFRLHAVLTGMRLNCVSIVTVYNALELRDMLPSPDDTVDARKSASSPSALPRMTTPHCVCLLVPIHEINDFNFVQWFLYSRWVFVSCRIVSYRILSYRGSGSGSDSGSRFSGRQPVAASGGIGTWVACTASSCNGSFPPPSLGGPT